MTFLSLDNGNSSKTVSEDNSNPEDDEKSWPVISERVEEQVNNRITK